MRQSNNVGTKEMISMEEYLEKRQKKRKSQNAGRPQKREVIERNTALEMAALFI